MFVCPIGSHDVPVTKARTCDTCKYIACTDCIALYLESLVARNELTLRCIGCRKEIDFHTIVDLVDDKDWLLDVYNPKRKAALLVNELQTRSRFTPFLLQHKEIERLQQSDHVESRQALVVLERSRDLGYLGQFFWYTHRFG